MDAPVYAPFQESWWLEAASPGSWDAVEVDIGGQTVARMPFVVEEKFGARILTQPPLTQFLGPWVRSTGAAPARATSREMNLYGQLIDALPKHDLFAQQFSPEVVNWLPFYWNGFSQTTRYTQVLDVSSPAEEILAGMDKRNRRQLRAAQNGVVAAVEDDLRTFLNLNDLTFARQGIRPNYDHDLVYRLDAAIRAHTKRWVIIAREKDEGEAIAAIYMFKYGDTLYSLMSGQDPAKRDLNGGIVARWLQVQVAHKHGRFLDFQGSMIQSIERRNRNYGALARPYFSITRSNGVLENRQKWDRRLRAPSLAAWRMKETIRGKWSR